jgi:uncharacterized protein YjbJ (UPF0337 family)
MTVASRRLPKKKMSRRFIMAGEMDKVKGRAKEAAGAATDDDELRREGRIDQAAGKTKDAAEEGVDKVKKAVTDNRE